ncbi:Cyanocobalamin Reductase / Alkylcobalamin Dealkylase [Manis pentadactyla]|nr:Cyanocobalamin Reductase / Alkylcobalamin Dealkylase [Manis pentadactyla]
MWPRDLGFTFIAESGFLEFQVILGKQESHRTLLFGPGDVHSTNPGKILAQLLGGSPAQWDNAVTPRLASLSVLSLTLSLWSLTWGDLSP